MFAIYFLPLLFLSCSEPVPSQNPLTEPGNVVISVSKVRLFYVEYKEKGEFKEEDTWGIDTPTHVDVISEVKYDGIESSLSAEVRLVVSVKLSPYIAFPPEDTDLPGDGTIPNDDEMEKVAAWFPAIEVHKQVAQLKKGNVQDITFKDIGIKKLVKKYMSVPYRFIHAIKFEVIAESDYREKDFRDNVAERVLVIRIPY